MISYIFKNKTKNILMIIFAVFSILCSDLLREIYISITIGVLPSGCIVFQTLPYVLILLYLLTLRREYRFKTWLFPCAFAIWISYYAYQLFVDVFYISSDYGYFIVTDIISYISFAFAIVASVFCFLGCIYNFKNVKFLKIGAIIKISANILITVWAVIIDYYMLDGKRYFENIFFEYLDQLYNSMFSTFINLLSPILFFVGILLLTLNKKSEYIDITPYVEARKAKKEAKHAAKLEAKQQEEARLNEPAPEIPEGSWRCMACGEILPDSIERCECGYKR